LAGVCAVMSWSEGQSRHQWAYETFGGAEVGNRRRARRVVAVAAGVAARTAGTVTDVFSDSADREGPIGCFRMKTCRPQRWTHALGGATARACAAHKKVYVVVDGSSLSLPDAKGLGGLAAWARGRTTGVVFTW
jgi:hypothetical protein